MGLEPTHRTWKDRMLPLHHRRWLQERDLNSRPSGYEPAYLPLIYPAIEKVFNHENLKSQELDNGKINAKISGRITPTRKESSRTMKEEHEK